SVAGVMLARMGYLTVETFYLDIVEDMFYAFYNALDQQPSASAFFNIGLLLMDYPTKEVVVLGGTDDRNRIRFLDSLQENFLPNISLLVAETPEDFGEIAPFATEYKQIDNDTTVYICETFACHEPTTDIEHAIQMVLG